LVPLNQECPEYLEYLEDLQVQLVQCNLFLRPHHRYQQDPLVPLNQECPEYLEDLQVPYIPFRHLQDLLVPPIPVILEDL
jgi:hypothetical protein